MFLGLLFFDWKNVYILVDVVVGLLCFMLYIYFVVVVVLVPILKRDEWCG